MDQHDRDRRIIDLFFARDEEAIKAAAHDRGVHKSEIYRLVL